MNPPDESLKPLIIAGQGARASLKSDFLKRCGPVAQLGEREHGMFEVAGSIPVRSTTNFSLPIVSFRFPCFIIFLLIDARPARCSLRSLAYLTGIEESQRPCQRRQRRV